MSIKNSRNFSKDLKDQNTVVDQVETIQHPLVKHVITQILAENASDSPQGSAFGEGGGAG